MYFVPSVSCAIRDHSRSIKAVQRRLDEHPEKMRPRRETVEHPFGTIEAEMGATQFLTKTLPRVAADMALHVLAYNLTRVMNTMGVQPHLAAMKAQSSQTCVLPAIRPEGLEVRALVSPRIVIETRPRPALSRPRLSGISVHRRLALGGLGGFGAGIRRRGVAPLARPRPARH
jgi:Transposase DDE domain